MRAIGNRDGHAGTAMAELLQGWRQLGIVRVEEEWHGAS
jgi:hypothetical protein